MQTACRSGKLELELQKCPRGLALRISMDGGRRLGVRLRDLKGFTCGG